MLKPPVALSVQAPPHLPPRSGADNGETDHAETDQLDPFWQLAGEMRDTKALIVARRGLTLMCGLLRLGCRAATVLRPGDKPDADDYGLVVVPRVSALASPDAVIRLVRRSLGLEGRLVAGVADAEAAAALARRLRLNGFRGLQMAHLPGLVLLRADLRRPS